MAKKTMNILMQSVAEMKRLELNNDIKLAYKQVKEELDEEFDEHMKGIAEEIISLQNSCKPKISYYIAGIILTLPPDNEPDVNEQNNEEFAFYVKMVKAAIGWGLLNGHGSPDNPFLDELREF
jgi:hypothetical protein